MSFKKKIYFSFTLSYAVVSILFLAYSTREEIKLTFLEADQFTESIVFLLQSPISFETKEGIEDVIQIFRVKENFLWTNVFDKSGKILAKYPDEAKTITLQKISAEPKVETSFKEFRIYKSVWSSDGSEIIGAVVSSFSIPIQRIISKALITVLITISVSVLTFIFIRQFLKAGFKGLASTDDAINRLGKGEIKDINIKTSDEFGQIASTWNKITAKLKEIIGSIQEGSRKTGEQSENLSSASEQIFQLISKISADIASIANATEEFSSAIEESTKRVFELSQKSNNMFEVGSRNKSEIDNFLKLVEGFSKEISVIVDFSRSLGEYLGKISNITETIEDIADQTNLLALNASIEAARAGEAGKGFTVVATEVRKLAEKTLNESKEIRELVSKINTAWKDFEKYLQNAEDILQNILGQFKNISNSYSTIISLSNEQKDMASSLSSTFEEQSKTTMELSQRVNQISSAMEQIKSTASNLLKLSKDIRKLSQEFNELASFFKI